MSYIRLISAIPLQPSISVCLLGLVEHLIPTVAGRTLVSLLVRTVVLRQKDHCTSLEKVGPTCGCLLEAVG